METNAYSHIKLFQKYGINLLTEQQIKHAVAEALELPWIKLLQVFSDQALFLLDLSSSKYLYVSPSVKTIFGYEPNDFTDFVFTASIMSKDELDASIKISNLLLEKFGELKLTPSDTLNLRTTRNSWISKKDGSIINILQHGFMLLLSEQGFPSLQLIIATDITSFNKQPEHFYSLTLTNSDGSQQVLLSEKLKDPSNLISEREQEVLKLISSGYSSEAIAEQLNISIETVKTHRKNLLEKTNSKNSIDLVRFGYANGWL